MCGFWHWDCPKCAELDTTGRVIYWNVFNGLVFNSSRYILNRWEWVYVFNELGWVGFNTKLGWKELDCVYIFGLNGFNHILLLGFPYNGVFGKSAMIMFLTTKHHLWRLWKLYSQVKLSFIWVDSQFSSIPWLWIGSIFCNSFCFCSGGCQALFLA